MASKDAKEAGASPASSGKLPPYKSFTAFVLSKHKYNLGDAVRVRGPSTNPADQFIGKITKIEARPGDNRNVMLTVKWYYRPDEIAGGRRPWHGKDELLASDHTDRIAVQSVNGPCRVLTFEEYQALDKEGNKGELSPSKEANVEAPAVQPDEEVYYWREEYDAKRKVIKTKLPTYCICNEPQNPDRMMVLCDACENWYHTTCVKATKKELAGTTWVCPSCRSKGVQIV